MTNNWNVIFETVNGTETVGVMDTHNSNTLSFALIDANWEISPAYGGKPFEDRHLEYAASDPEDNEYAVYFKMYPTDDATTVSAEDVEDWIADIPSLGVILEKEEAAEDDTYSDDNTRWFFDETCNWKVGCNDGWN